MPTKILITHPQNLRPAAVVHRLIIEWYDETIYKLKVSSFFFPKVVAFDGKKKENGENRTEHGLTNAFFLVQSHFLHYDR